MKDKICLCWRIRLKTNLSIVHYAQHHVTGDVELFTIYHL